MGVRSALWVSLKIMCQKNILKYSVYITVNAKP